MRNPLAKLLIVDDEVAQMVALCRTLEGEGYATTGFTSPKEALAALREQEFDLVLTDLMMPDMDGIALLTAGQEIDRDLVAIVMTGHSAVATAVQAMKAGALDYIQKPFDLSNILPVLTRALTVRRLRTENIQLRQAVAIHELSTAFTHELNLRSAANKVADAACAQASDGEVAVLVLSQSGDEFEVAATRGASAQKFIGTKVNFSPALKEWVAQTTEKLSGSSTWLIGDFYCDYGLKDFAFAVAMPMLVGGDLVGILSVTSASQVSSVTLGDLKTLNLLAGTAASAMQVISLLERLRHANDDLDLRVRRRTAELEEANRELEAFSYSISHDLRAPLRAITGYSEILAQEFGAQISADAQRACDAIRLAARRMGELIDDLLELSLLSRQEVIKRQVDPSTLLAKVLHDLRGEHADRNVEVTIHSLPPCTGDQSLLRQVFFNLLSNAFKFTKGHEHPVVEVGAQEEPGELIYFIRDNGAGFDMSQAERLFGVFQRLHSSAEFDGTGIGLSIVQRIIDRHGGRAWAKGEVGKGATFYFSLPKAD